jgi:branched-chain amino acid transport system ATP-binding protein
MAVGGPILQTTGMTKEFRGFVAVSDVNLCVGEGSIHALIGPNGAGKTTCFNLLTKFLKPTRGTIHFRGADITRLGAHEIARSGLVRSFQISSVFPYLSAFENVKIALQSRQGSSYGFWRSPASLRALDDRAIELLYEVGLSDYVDTHAAVLPYGRKRALEIATTLALDPTLLLLDEPTAGMTDEDIERVVALIRRVRVNRTIVIVEHNLSVVQGLCDRITVLARGRVLAEGDYTTVSRHPEVITAYLGSPDE